MFDPLVFGLLFTTLGIPLFYFANKKISSYKKQFPYEENESVTIYHEDIDEKQNFPVFIDVKPNLSDVEKWLEKSSTDDPVIKILFTEVLSSYYITVSELSKLDIEDTHKVKQSIQHDILNLFLAYLDIERQTRHLYQEKVADGLLQLKSELDDIRQKIEEKDIHQLEKTLLLIEQRYKK